MNMQNEIIKKYNEYKNKGKLNPTNEVIELKQEFYKKFNPEIIANCTGEDLLFLLFAPSPDTTKNLFNKDTIGLNYWLEEKSVILGIYTGHAGKAPTYYSDTKNSWMKVVGVNTTVDITKDEAIIIAEQVKKQIIELNNYLKYGDWSKFKDSFPNDRYYRFYHKYFYILYPKYLTSYHAKDFAANYKALFNIHPNNKLALEDFLIGIAKGIDVDDLRQTLELGFEMPMKAEMRKKLENWVKFPEQICSKAIGILSIFTQKNIYINKQQWQEILKLAGSTSPYKTMSSLACDNTNSNNYGNITYFEDNLVKLEYPIFTQSLNWVVSDEELLQAEAIVHETGIATIFDGQEKTQVEEVRDGEMIERKILTYKRNREIVIKAKERAKYKCEACDFYYDNKIIEAHHLIPLSLTGETKITIDELIVLCPNCHSIAHYLLKKDDIYQDRGILKKELKTRIQ